MTSTVATTPLTPPRLCSIRSGIRNRLLLMRMMLLRLRLVLLLRIRVPWGLRVGVDWIRLLWEHAARGKGHCGYGSSGLQKATSGTMQIRTQIVQHEEAKRSGEENYVALGVVWLLDSFISIWYNRRQHDKSKEVGCENPTRTT
jgi:hypothetical protein